MDVKQYLSYERKSWIAKSHLRAILELKIGKLDKKFMCWLHKRWDADAGTLTIRKEYVVAITEDVIGFITGLPFGNKTDNLPQGLTMTEPEAQAMIKFYKNENDNITFNYVTTYALQRFLEEPRRLNWSEFVLRWMKKHGRSDDVGKGAKGDGIITYLDRIRYQNDRGLRWNTNEARISTWLQDDMVCAIQGDTNQNGEYGHAEVVHNVMYGLKYPVGTPYVLPSWDKLGTDQTAEPGPVFNPRERPTPPRHAFIPIFHGGKRTRKRKLNSEKSGHLEDERERGTMSFPPRTRSQGAAELKSQSTKRRYIVKGMLISWLEEPRRENVWIPHIRFPHNLGPTSEDWNETHILFSVREIGISLTRSTLRFCFDSRGKIINEVIGAIVACCNYDNRESNQFYVFPPFLLGSYLDAQFINYDKKYTDNNLDRLVDAVKVDIELHKLVLTDVIKFVLPFFIKNWWFVQIIDTASLKLIRYDSRRSPLCRCITN
ncbi:hypothetical protein SOVF_005790 [Spinacia oleracea]|nr:hypothetical protein SOVF_005790 [Spinacia oleracea]